mgnify:CR=1 FL=1|tara:strand:+ start:94 stop:483 length:390 start_codon:yes stop_codon:yes gene_type:complete
MNKTKIWLLISFLSISPLALSEVINLTCFNEGQVHKEQKDWTVGKNRLIKFNLGESSKLAKMSAKGYPLIEFDLKVTDTYFLIGQYKSHLKVDLIPIFIINKSTLIVETDSFFSQQNLPKEPRKCLIEY